MSARFLSYVDTFLKAYKQTEVQNPALYLASNPEYVSVDIYALNLLIHRVKTLPLSELRAVNRDFISFCGENTRNLYMKTYYKYALEYIDTYGGGVETLSDPTGEALSDPLMQKLFLRFLGEKIKTEDSVREDAWYQNQLQSVKPSHMTYAEKIVAAYRAGIKPGLQPDEEIETHTEFEYTYGYLTIHFDSAGVADRVQLRNAGITYTLGLIGNTITLTTPGGNRDFTLPDDTQEPYTLTKAGDTLTLECKDGDDVEWTLEYNYTQNSLSFSGSGTAYTLNYNAKQYTQSNKTVDMNNVMKIEGPGGPCNEGDFYDTSDGTLYINGAWVQIGRIEPYTHMDLKFLPSCDFDKWAYIVICLMFQDEVQKSREGRTNFAGQEIHGIIPRELLGDKLLEKGRRLYINAPDEEIKRRLMQ